MTLSLIVVDFLWIVTIGFHFSFPFCFLAMLESYAQGKNNLYHLLVISNHSNDHGVQVEEEEEQMDSKLDKALLLVLAEGSENFSGIQQMCVGVNPKRLERTSSSSK